MGTGDVVEHTFVESIFHTVTLRVTNPNTGLFGESQVDIDVINNSPTAVVTAQPQSGPAPLNVSFSAAQSSDTETSPSDLIYQWDFGDGFAANDDGEPGILINIEHFFNPDGEGVEKFTVMLTVTDVGGQSDVDSIEITVGNTLPVAAVVVTSSTAGPAPHQLVVNAINSFDAEDTPAGIPLIVAWNWGDDTSDTFDQYGMNPDVPDGTVIHEYVAIGQYQVSAIVTDSAGDSAQWMGPLITVNDATVDPNAPQASFTISPEGSVEVGEEITLDAGQSSDPNGGEIVSYNWILGDGSQATGIVATHAYDAPGNYVILLVVTNDAGLTAGLEKLVVVTGDGGTGPGEPPVPENNKPTALFTASANEVSVDEVITFDAKDSSDPDAGDTLTYVWDFGDGEAGSGVTVSHAYAAADDYVVKLTVTDTSNASDTNTKSIAVIEAVENLPPVPFIATGPRSTTVGVGLPFDGRLSYDTDGLVVGYEWIFSLDEEVVATNDSGPQITHTFDTAGIYTVVLRVTDNDGAVADSLSEIITVGSQVVPVVTVDPSDGPDGVDVPVDSALARPQLCGLGLLTSVLGSLLGLSLTMASRRRRSR